MNKVNYEIWRGEGTLTLIESGHALEQPFLIAEQDHIATLEVEFDDQEDLNSKLNEFRDTYLKDNWDNDTEKWKTVEL